MFMQKSHFCSLIMEPQRIFEGTHYKELNIYLSNLKK